MRYQRRVESSSIAVRSSTGAREAHPEFDGATASFFNFGESFGPYVISSNDDVSMRFIRELGFAGAPPQVLALPPEVEGEAARSVISAERYDLLDADVILGTTSDPDQSVFDDLREQDLFARVPAVARGGFLGLGIGPATAMAFPRCSASRTRSANSSTTSRPRYRRVPPPHLARRAAPVREHEPASVARRVVAPRSGSSAPKPLDLSASARRSFPRPTARVEVAMSSRAARALAINPVCRLSAGQLEGLSV